MAGLGNFVPASRPAWGLQAAAAAARPPLPPPGARLFPASRGCSVRAGPAAGDGASGSLGRCPWHSHPVWAKGLLPACAALPVPTQWFQNVSLREAPRWDVGLQGCCCCFSKNESARSVVTGL